MVLQVGIVTASELPQPDPDEPALVDELRALGADTHVLPWDDDTVAWQSLDVAVVRSTWNYVPQRERFLRWAERAARLTLLLNPADVLRTNTDKIYLRDLEARGVGVVPTLFVDRASSAAAARAEIDRRGWVDVVIKPRVSAGSMHTERFPTLRDVGASRVFLATHLPLRDMIAQPFQASVDHWGERSLIWIDGELTHAVRKSPRLSSQPIVLSRQLAIEPDERGVATRALAPVASRILYARVDLVRDETGAPRVMEIELTEPYLMLDRSPVALARLASAIVRRGRERRSLGRDGPG